MCWRPPTGRRAVAADDEREEDESPSRANDDVDRERTLQEDGCVTSGGLEVFELDEEGVEDAEKDVGEEGDAEVDDGVTVDES